MIIIPGIIARHHYWHIAHCNASQWTHQKPRGKPCPWSEPSFDGVMTHDTDTMSPHYQRQLQHGTLTKVTDKQAVYLLSGVAAPLIQKTEEIFLPLGCLVTLSNSPFQLL